MLRKEENQDYLLCVFKFMVCQENASSLMLVYGESDSWKYQVFIFCNIKPTESIPLGVIKKSSCKIHCQISVHWWIDCLVMQIAYFMNILRIYWSSCVTTERMLKNSLSTSFFFKIMKKCNSIWSNLPFYVFSKASLQVSQNR